MSNDNRHHKAEGSPSLLPVDDALKRILEDVRPLDAEEVPLAAATGRILAEPLAASRDMPPFDASSMDGYAVRAKDVRQVPVELRVIAEAAAGHGVDVEVGAGEAVRIFTGSPLPKGADCIIIQENTEREGDVVRVLQPGVRGRFIRERGMDYRAGETLLQPGTKLGARQINLAASLNFPVLPVRRKPRIAILATGDELVLPGQEPGPDQIIASNSFGLAAFIEQHGGEPVDLGLQPDDVNAIAEAIERGAEADVLISIGGASVGDYDFVGTAFDKLGIARDFWRIAMRPGKPLMFARRGKQRILGLPGNPVSALVCSFVFLRPLMAALLGTDMPLPRQMAVLGADLPENDLRQDYLRVRLQWPQEGTEQADAPDVRRLLPVALPFSRQDSAMLRRLVEADALLVRPPFAPPLAKGTLVEVLRIDF